MTQDKQLFYDRFADEFDSKMNMYDTEKRVRVLFEQLLPEDLSGKRLLDAGSGTGWFSKRATERGASVTSIDIGHQLLRKVGEKCETDRAACDICQTGLAGESFDFIVSSEVIEHVPNPRLSITELNRLLKPGGVIVLSTPNKVWHFAITLANKMGARPYEGFENWVGYGELRDWFEEEGLVVESQIGLHLFPFISSLSYPILDFMDRFGKSLGPIMLNQAIRARKPDAP